MLQKKHNERLLCTDIVEVLLLSITMVRFLYSKEKDRVGPIKNAKCNYGNSSSISKFTFIILSPSQLRPASFDLRQFEPVALFTQIVLICCMPSERQVVPCSLNLPATYSPRLSMVRYTTDTTTSIMEMQCLYILTALLLHRGPLV